MLALDTLIPRALMQATARHRLRPLLLLLCLGSLAPETRAQASGGRWAALPILFSSPDTGFAAGVLPQYLFYTSEGARTSSIRVDAYYTQERQYHLQLRPSLWLRDNRYGLSGKASYKKWPTTFYGVGVGTGIEETYTERFLAARLDGQRLIRPGLYAGLRYDLRSGRLSQTEPGGVLDAHALAGSGVTTVSGVGGFLSWDTRNNVNYPTRGRLAQASVTGYASVLGSDHGFASFGLDVRSYHPLGERHVVALRADGTFTAGGAPFQMLPGIGSTLRGYGSARYVDRHSAVVQAEYRLVPAWWRLGLVVFAGAGTVAPRLDAFDADDIRGSAGLGLRFRIYRQEQVSIRLDYAWGVGSAGEYIDLMEAF